MPACLGARQELTVVQHLVVRTASRERHHGADEKPDRLTGAREGLVVRKQHAEMILSRKAELVDDRNEVLRVVRDKDAALASRGAQDLTVVRLPSSSRRSCTEITSTPRARQPTAISVEYISSRVNLTRSPDGGEPALAAARAPVRNWPVRHGDA